MINPYRNGGLPQADCPYPIIKDITTADTVDSSINPTIIIAIILTDSLFFIARPLPLSVVRSRAVFAVEMFAHEVGLHRCAQAYLEVVRL